MSDDGFFLLGNGPHQVRVDGDVVFMRSIGMTRVDDLDALAAIYDRVLREHRSLFVIYDSRKGGGVDRPARKVLMERSSMDPRPLAAAAFGAKFSSRILISMIDRALVAFGKKPSGVAMFDTEEQARAYIDKERMRLQNQRKSQV